MTARPTDWSPLDCPNDPVSGDPDAVREAARQYSSTAEAIKTAQTSLTNLSYQSRGQAVAELQNKARELAGQVGQAYSRCEGASEALNGYAPHLENAQKTSLEALREAEKNKRDLEGVQNQKREVERAYYKSRNPQERENLKQQYMRLGGQESSAQSAINAAKAKLNQAIEERDSAAQAATEKLNYVGEKSPIKDGLWDKFKGALRKLAQVAEFLKPILETISNILTIVCIVVAIFFPPVGTALLVMAFAVSAAKFICNTVCNASKLADGKMGVGEFLGNLAIDGAFLAMEAAGLKAATAGAKAGKEAMKAGREAAKSGAGKNLTEGAIRSSANATADATKKAVENSATGVRKGLINLNKAINAPKDALKKRLTTEITPKMGKWETMTTTAANELIGYEINEGFGKLKSAGKDILLGKDPTDTECTFKKAKVK